MTWAVGEAFQPSFFSGAPKLKPSAPFSISTQDMPFGPASPVRTITA
jgi:hypothetical protein